LKDIIGLEGFIKKEKNGGYEPSWDINDTLCTAILKQKCLFSKMEHRKVKQVLSGDWHQGEVESI
jgi:hypothetical protein